MPEMKDGTVELRRIRTPDEAIAPGGEYTIAFDCYNHASIIFNDPDACGSGENVCSASDPGETAGYCVAANAATDAAHTGSATFCLNAAPFPPSHETASVTLTAPQNPGEYTVEGWLNANASGASTDAVTGSITVSESATPGPKGPGDSTPDEPSMKGGRVTLDNIATPATPMQPGMNAEIGVVASNHASVILNDVDECAQAGNPCENTVDGYCIRNDVYVDQSGPVTHRYCLNLPWTGTGKNTEYKHVVVGLPPTPGEYLIQVQLTAPGSGSQTGFRETTITVSEDAPAPGENNTYTLEQFGENPDGGGDGGIIPGDVEGLAILAVAGIGLYAVAKTADAAGDILGQPDADGSGDDDDEKN